MKAGSSRSCRALGPRRLPNTGHGLVTITTSLGDTPRPSHLMKSDSGCIFLTGSTGRGNMAQRSKGQRHVITARLPISDAEKLAAVVAATDENRSDLVARLVHSYLETIDLDRITGQEAFPIAKAS